MPAWKHILAQFEAHLQQSEMALSTIAAYLNDVRGFALWLGDYVGQETAPSEFSSCDVQAYKEFLKAWIWKASQTGNRYLAKFVNALRHWWTEILNYFGERVTNGFVEGMNRAIRAIISRAYGYRNFENFRLQVLAQHGPPILSPTIS